MTTREYINELFKVATNQMGMPYIRTVPERLQEWSIDNNHKTFIALLDVDTTTNISFAQNDSNTANLTLVSVVETTNVNPENNYSNEEVEYYKGEVSRNIKNFVNLIAKNINVNAITYSTSEDEVFKDPRFLGIGLGFEMTLELSDTDDSCDFFGNTQTIDV
jgi:hypothetical protein